MASNNAQLIWDGNNWTTAYTGDDTPGGDSGEFNFVEQLASKAQQSDVSQLQAKTVFYPQGGFNFVMWSTGQNATYKSFIDSWDLTVVKRVCFEFLFKWNTSNNPNNTNIYQYNPDSEIIDLIQYIQGKGIEITSLRPRFTTGDLSTYPVASANTATFLSNYQTLIQHCVDTFAVPYGIKNFTVSVELASYTSTNQSTWQSIISYIQGKGLKATVSYGWGEQNTSVFNSYLDSIGLNIYPFVSDKDFSTTLNYALQNLYSSTYMQQLITFKNTYNKPLWIAETGTTSGQYALANPASTNVGSTTNNIIQWIYFKAVLQYFGQATINNAPLFDHLFIWDLGSSTDGFNPLNNPMATEVIKEYFSLSYYNVNTFSVSGNPAYPNTDTSPKIVNNILYTENKATDLRNKQTLYNVYRGSNITITDDIYPHYLKGKLLGQTTFSGITPTSVSNPTITVKSRNLLDYTTYTTATSYVTTLNDKLDIKVVRPSTGYGNYIYWTLNNLTIGNTYSFSFKYKVLNGLDACAISIRNSDGSDYADGLGSNGLATITFTAKATSHNAELMVDYGVSNPNGEVLVYDIQFENGTPTEYIKYMNYSLSLTGTFQQFDYVDFATKDIVQQTNSFTLQGAAGETWAVYHPSGGDHTNTITFELSNTTTVNSDFSNSLQNLTTNFSFLPAIGLGGVQTVFSYDVEGISQYSDHNIYLNISRSRIGLAGGATDATAVSTFTSWLSSNNMVVQYQTPTATHTALVLPDNIVVSTGSTVSVTSGSSTNGVLQLDCPSTLGKAKELDGTYANTNNIVTWSNWNPALTWSTANPVTPTITGKYKVIGKTVFFILRIYSTNGNGATGLLLYPPITPKTNNLLPYFNNTVIINGSSAHQYFQMRDNGTNNDMKFTYMGTATASQTLEINIQGCYEIN